MAFEIKAAKQVEGELITVKFDRKKGDYSALKKVEALLGDEEKWEQWRELKAEQNQAEMEHRVKIRFQKAMVASTSGS